MKLESPSFFSSGTGVRQTYPCMEYRLGTNGLVAVGFANYVSLILNLFAVVKFYVKQNLNIIFVALFR
jgi:hypothetical protein